MYKKEMLTLQQVRYTRAELGVSVQFSNIASSVGSEKPGAIFITDAEFPYRCNCRNHLIMQGEVRTKLEQARVDLSGIYMERK